MQDNVWADHKWEKTLVIWGFVCLTTLCHIIRKLTTPRLSSLYMFIDLSISHFARDKGIASVCIPLSALITNHVQDGSTNKFCKQEQVFMQKAMSQ